MNNWTLAGIIALAVVICAGSIIKYITHSRLRDLDGTYEVVQDNAVRGEPHPKETEPEKQVPNETEAEKQVPEEGDSTEKVPQDF